MQTQNNILVIGAGLCGSLLTLRLAQRGYNVTLVEKRPDLRKTTLDAGRSINLALSSRGLKAMALVGLENEVEALCLPMKGRMIHDKEGNTFLSPYSGREEEYIRSISRPGLNELLLNAAEKLPNVTLKFNLGCEHVDLKNANSIFKDYTTNETIEVSSDVIFGTDGAGSSVRKSMFNDKELLFSYSIDWLSHSYKELTIPALPNNEFKIDKNALHIWPRGKDMLIALPNLDGSFTVTLFLSNKDSVVSFESLTSKEAVNTYFQEDFPDALALMPNLADEFFENPTGTLGTVKCYPWSSNGKTLIMGDAAHAIVPFYGQGMNASFEDVVVFDAVLNANPEASWKSLFEIFEKDRKKDTDAIADLAIDNFHEMKEHTASALFQEKRKLEIAFEKHFPTQYFSKYALVTFNANISYSNAMLRGRAQDKAILNLISDKKITNEQSLEEKFELVQNETQAILHDDAIVKNL